MRFTKNQEVRLKQLLKECEIHGKRILQAKKACSGFFPLTPTLSQNLNEEQVRIVDQLVYRFSKLQDTMGAKLFPLLIELFYEKNPLLTFFDMLNMLEKRTILESAEQWIRLREIRNQIAHEYESDADNATEYLNQVYFESETLVNIMQQVTTKIRTNLLPGD